MAKPLRSDANGGGVWLVFYPPHYDATHARLQCLNQETFVLSGSIKSGHPSHSPGSHISHRTRADAHTHALTHAITHAITHARTCTHAHRLAHACIRTHSHMHACTHTRTHARARTHLHSYTYTQAHAHTRTHTRARMVGSCRLDGYSEEVNHNSAFYAPSFVVSPKMRADDGYRY